MKATILYSSRRGKTASFAREIAMHLWSQGLSVSLCSIGDFTPEKMNECQLLVLGCWTSGWFVVNQHPNRRWVQFAQDKLTAPLPPHLLLFTTYKLHTGSMFRNMKRQLTLRPNQSVQTLKSKTGILTEEQKKSLDLIAQKVRLGEATTAPITGDNKTIIN